MEIIPGNLKCVCFVVSRQWTKRFTFKYFLRPHMYSLIKMAGTACYLAMVECLSPATFCLNERKRKPISRKTRNVNKSKNITQILNDKNMGERRADTWQSQSLTGRVTLASTVKYESPGLGKYSH